MQSLYDQIGDGYPETRRRDPRIAERIVAALGDAASVVNVGAGAGSYEPRDGIVVAVEPSWTMIRQRPAGSAPAVRAAAEALPLGDGAVDSQIFGSVAAASDNREIYAASAGGIFQVFDDGAAGRRGWTAALDLYDVPPDLAGRTPVESAPADDEPPEERHARSSRLIGLAECELSRRNVI